MSHMRLGLVAGVAFAMAAVFAVLAIADQANSGLTTTICGLAAIVFAVVGVRLLMATTQRR